MKTKLERDLDSVALLCTPLLLSSSVMTKLGMYWGCGVSLMILLGWDVVLCLCVARGDTWAEGLSYLFNLVWRDRRII